MIELPAASTETTRPLVYRVGALGDTILLTALLRSLSIRWGRPCDVVVRAPWHTTVLKGLDSVGTAIALGSRRTPYPLSRQQRSLVLWLRERRPDPVYFVDGIAKEAWLLRRGGVSDDRMVTMHDLPSPPRQHHLDHLHDFARHVPAAMETEDASLRPMPDPPPAPELAVSSGELADCRAWLASLGWDGEPVVAVQTLSRHARKGRWPQVCWTAALRAVLERVPGAWVLLIGSPREASEVQSLADAVGDARVREVASQLGDLRRLFALLSMAHSCISLDTGPSHAAVAVGCPTVVIFGAGHPNRYRPVGPPEIARFVTALPERDWPDDHARFAAVHRIEEITVDQVVDEWQRLAHRA